MMVCMVFWDPSFKGLFRSQGNLQALQYIVLKPYTFTYMTVYNKQFCTTFDNFTTLNYTITKCLKYEIFTFTLYNFLPLTPNTCTSYNYPTSDTKLSRTTEPS